MSNTKFLTLAVALAVAGSLSAADHKHPDDKCPPGSRTVEKTSTTSGHVDAGVKVGKVGGEARIEKSTTEKETVCRDFDKGSKDKNTGSKDTGGSKDKNTSSKDTGGSKDKNTGSKDHGGSKDKSTGSKDTGGSKDKNTGSKDTGGSKDKNTGSKDHAGSKDTGSKDIGSKASGNIGKSRY